MLVFDAELPGVWLDQLTLDASTAQRIRVLNRDPEPDERAVPPLPTIVLYLTDIGTAPLINGLSAAQTRIYVDGVLAVDAVLGFQPGWDGPGSSVVPVGAGAVITLAKVGGPYESEHVVNVRVLSGTSDGLATLDTTYSFTVDDTAAPLVLSAQAVAHKLVQLAFSEPVRQLGDGAAGDALRAENYALAPTSAPAVTPRVLSARVLTSTAVELTLDTELTQRAAYDIVVTDVLDLRGNAVAAPYNHAAFAGYACATPSGRAFDLYKMLPAKNRREDDTQDLLRFVACVQELVDLQLCEIDSWSSILDPDYADEQFVDAMLLDAGNPFSFDLSLVDKRRLLRVLVSIYKQKGTAPGVINVVRFFLGLEVQVQAYVDVGMSLGESELGSDGTDGEWELGPSGSFARYAFNIVVARTLTDVERVQLRALVDYMKPAHTHFVFIVEPTPPTIIDHLELGLSELGVDWELH